MSEAGTSRSRCGALRLAIALLSAVLVLSPVGTAQAARADETWAPISGSGSTWAQNAVEQWRYSVATDYEMTVYYNGTGSTTGRNEFINNWVDFAISELPFQTTPSQGPAETPPADFAYVPIAAGGTALAYHLRIAGVRVTDLRLSGDVVARIFAGTIVNWNDPAIQADNPRLVMPDRGITPVVRADSSGSSAQFTGWMSTQYPLIWTQGTTSAFPVPANGKAQKGSDGVAGYVAQAYGEGAITYVEHSTAVESGLPAAKVRNEGGYYVAPTAKAVSIALLAAHTDAAGIAQLGGVYDNPDPRAYPLSGYASMIVPTAERGTFTVDKGRTLAAFATYAVCAGQRLDESWGYAALPVNLVEHAGRGIQSIPGAAAFDLASCDNPTFLPGESVASNKLLREAPAPAEEDRYTAPTEPDAAVHEEDLTEPLKTLEISTTEGSAVIGVRAGEGHAHKTVQAGAFSDPASLGQITLDASGDGTVDIAASGLAEGTEHKLYLAESDGTVLAWNTFTVPVRQDGPGDPAPSGRFELLAPTTEGLDLGAVRRGGATSTSDLGTFTVIDDRADLRGWDLHVDVQDFTNLADDTAHIPASALGFAPVATELREGIVLGAAQPAGSAIYAAIVARGAPASTTGAAGIAFNAELTLAPPRGAARGMYRSTLTLTLTSP